MSSGDTSSTPLSKEAQSSSSEEPLKGLKRNYLSLLPQVQIIEICLAFEQHVPSQVLDTIWPTDLEAAILALKKSTPPSTNATVVAVKTLPWTHPQPTIAADVPSQQVHPPGQNTRENGPPPMGSLMDDTSTRHSTPALSAEKSSATAFQGPVASTSTSPASTSQSLPAANSQPTSHTTTSQHLNALPQPLAPYPYAPYGYTPPNQPQQPAYPHTPYYPSPHAYPYPYPGYPPPYPSSSSGHTHGQAPHPHYPLAHLSRDSPSHHASVAGPSAPSPGPPPPPTDDLPSYEEMIVEALLEMGDPEGAAPKDLFTWMASRYPLQTNFRPSASQALQKAYKRGRLEKRAGGRYRLNPTWEGGATSKRTTRRPQTLAQTTYAMHHPPQPPSSPFTNAPLTHHHQPQHQQYAHTNNSPAPSSYPVYPYGYPAAGYPPYGAPGYSSYPPPPDATAAQERPSIQSSTTAPAVPTTTAAASNLAAASPSNAAPAAKEGEKVGPPEGDAGAWQAAQHILEAINFGSLELLDQEGGSSSAAGASHLPPVVASAGFDFSSVASGSSSAVRTALTDDERASLQAQLALLAAQLVEIADAEDEEEEEGEADVVPVPQPLTSSNDAPRANTTGEDKSTDMSVPQSSEQFTAEDDALQAVLMGVTSQLGNASAGAEEEEESDEDGDMEMVEVPAYPGTALRT